MRRIRTVGSAFVLALCTAQVSCFWIAPVSQTSSETLMEAVRSYGGGKSAAPSAPMKESDFESAAQAERTNEEEDEYKRHVKSLFNSWDFAGLDKEAREDRATKSRLVGGEWKLYRFYDAVSEPTSGATGEMDWVNHLEALRQWEAKEPNSVTPRIALAQAMVNYAWNARGVSTAYKVSDQSWKLFGERLELAARTLLEAAKMQEKCPHWFSVMQIVALGEGWDRNQARELLERAASFEPDYDRYYRNYAYYMLPKWYGEEGDSESVANEFAKSLGGEHGQFVYFQIARDIICTCEADKPPMPKDLSWPKLQAGFDANERLYGVSNIELNDYALMAYSANDKATAQQIFSRIGDDWSQPTWWNEEIFKDAKAWAAGT